MFGKNSEGQLGTGNLKPQSAPIEVKIFEEKPASVSMPTYIYIRNSEYCF